MSELNSEDINTIDFTSIPAENLSLLANSGLNFEQLNTEGVNQIDFNSIPAEDIGILADSGLNLESASNEAVNNVSLGVAADFGYIDEAAFNTNILSADTTFGELSSTVVNNANLFNYKGDLNLEDGFSLSEAQQLDSSDYQALDFAFDGDSIFDSSYYLEQNSDVAGEGVNPFTQYFVTGATEGRDPTVYFDSSYYLEEYTDVANEGVNPLLQYFNTGADELFRDPDPAFDTSFYLEEYPEVAEAGLNPLLQYANTGASEGRYANETFKTLEESQGIWKISPDIKGEEFQKFKDKASTLSATKQFGLSENPENPNLLGVLIEFGKYVVTGQILKDSLEKAEDILDLIENGRFFVFPKNEQLTQGKDGNFTTFPDGEINVPTGTPEFDLAKPIGFDDNAYFPKGDGVIDDIVNGRFEFPTDGEEFTYFYASIGEPNWSEGYLTGDKSNPNINFGTRTIEDVITEQEIRNEVINSVKTNPGVLNNKVRNRYKQGGGNIAIADYNIDGETDRIESYSGKGNLPGFAEYVPNEQRKLKAYEVKGRIGDVDSEAKILEQIYNDTTAESEGEIRIFTKNPVCKSCGQVIEDFVKDRPKIKIEVIEGI